MNATLFERIWRGETAIASAKSEGRDVREWEAHLKQLKREASVRTNQPQDGPIIAVLIDSSVLGAPIWFAFTDWWTQREADNIPIFYASELPALRQKAPEQLCSIFNVKRAFGGGLVRQ